MAESDRKRLLERALALPQAEESDFFGERRPPADADLSLLKRINDTSLRTKLVDARLATGLQSPKGPQKIASIVRLYPDFDAPGRTATPAREATPPRAHPTRAKSNARAKAQPQPQRGLPSVAEMERLIARIRETEAAVTHELGAEVDERIAFLKRALADLEGDELDAAYRELGAALERKRALASQVHFETFRRIERATDFSERTYLRMLRH